MDTSNQKKEQVKKLLNDLNLGTSKAELGEFIVGLLDKIEALEARVTALEGA